LIPTKNGSIDFTGSGTLSAEAALVISMFCDLIGSGTLSANIFGLLDMSVDLIGEDSMESSLSGIASMLIDMYDEGSLEATIAAFGNMSIDIVVTGTGLSTSNVGQAVWDALQVSINNPGTAGAALLAAGSAGDPWSTLLPAGYVGDQAGNILSQIQTLIDELHKLKGLNASAPVTITPTSITATGIDIAIGGDGENLSTLERQ
jgi:hypothetical protein